MRNCLRNRPCTSPDSVALFAVPNTNPNVVGTSATRAVTREHFDVEYDYSAVGEAMNRATLATNPDRSMWRYRPIMPVAADAPTDGLQVGATPLIHAPRLAKGLASLHIKDEGRQPTASLKDRASAVALARAAMESADVVTTASTGNAAAALAGLAANTGQRTVIFVPASAPEAKVAQLLGFGATVALVDGNYGTAVDLCMAAAARFGWYNRTTGYNPYVAEGKKTVSLEICEQLEWEAPDAVFVSVGDGSIIGGVHKGFTDAKALGWIDAIPRVYGIQASGQRLHDASVRVGGGRGSETGDHGCHRRRFDQCRPSTRSCEGVSSRRRFQRSIPASR